MTDKLKTIVLRRSISAFKSGAPIEPIAAPSEAQPEAPVMSESLELTDGERFEIADEEDVIAVGLAMPLTLVKPFAGSASVAVGDSWGVDAIGADALDPNAGAGVKVAVLDTGIAEHDAFDGVNPITKNFTDDVDEDTNGHGTHCAGTIFGRDVGGQRIGIARGVTEPLIAKVLGRGGGDGSAVMDAIMWAQREGAKVISMSLGIDFPLFQRRLVESGRGDLEATSIALQAYRENVRLFDRLADVFSEAITINAPLLIAAAGNESDRPRFTIATAPPAEADGIFSVGAIGRSNAIARFSNTGPDCCAPGVDILSADHANRSGLKLLSGTSMATPHVAGAAVIHAQRLAQNGRFSARQLREEVLANVVPVSGLSRADAGRGALRV